MNTTASADLPRLTGDLEQAKRDLVRWGYCLMSNVIAEDECKRLLDRLIEQADLEGEQGVAYMADGHSPLRRVDCFAANSKPAWQSVVNLLNKGREFIDLAMNPKLHELSVHAFHNVPFDLSSVRGLIQRRGARDRPLHIDQILVPVPTPMPILCNLTVTLTPYTEANGATRVVPGSHRLAPPHLGRDGNAMPEVALEAPPGTAIVWEGRTWHRAAADNSDAERVGVVVVTNMQWVRQQDVYAASLHDRVYESLTREERNFVGFTSTGFNCVGPRFPGDRSNAIGGTTELQTFVGELRRSSSGF